MKLVRTTSARGSAAALALLWALAPILAYAHMLHVGHATCPEHGELVHLDAAAPDAAAARPTDPLAGGGVALESSEDGEAHEHQHCVAATARKAQAAVSSARPALLLAATATLQPVGREAIARPASALYLLAPKTSPPA